MRRAAVAGGLGLLTALLAVGFLGCGPPQMGADEEVFTAVDALFTAVTARDPKLLGKCELRLNDLKNAEKLPASAAAYLDGVVRQARERHWESAAGRLYDFMRVQRREGAVSTPRR
jgi:hypothetical protein